MGLRGTPTAMEGEQHINIPWEFLDYNDASQAKFAFLTFFVGQNISKKTEFA